MAAPCARFQLVRGPVRKSGRGRPFNTIVRQHRIGAETMTKAKQTSLMGAVIVISGGVLLGISMEFDTGPAVAADVVGALLFGLGWFVVVRVKCDSCGRRLSSMFPAGSLLVLWAAKQPCKNCGAYL